MKPLVIIPTFNEAGSIFHVIESVLEISPNLDVLVVDDNSPDGTAEIVAEIDPQRVHLLRRPAKSGLGGAYRLGMEWALARPEYTHVVTMDGDGSHRAVDLALMLLAAKPGVEVVLGTRWMPGGSIENWPKYRQFLSQSGTSYARWALKLPLRDLTGGFRVYSRTLLERLRLNAVSSDGYCFQIEMIRAASAASATTIESPITFVERESGESKMSKRIVREALIRVSIWGLQRRLDVNADKLHYVK
ncbi:MAG TPA: polyprenol monophosphomannose synthase [Candidatus Nanopelagicaceae bacterium]